MLVAIGIMVLAAIVAAILRPRTNPTPTPLPLGKVKPYLSNGLLLAPDGSLWGMDFHQSGGATSLSYSPFAPGNDWAQASGSRHAGVGIKEDGTLWFWQTQERSWMLLPPIQIGTDTDWASARYSSRRAVLLKKDGTIWFMGHTRADGRVGPVGLVPSPPAQIGIDRDWIAAELSEGVQWGLKRDGTVWRWGWPSGRYDLYQTPPEPTPVLLSPDHDWRSIAAGFRFVTAIKRDGSIWLQGTYSHFVTQDYIHPKDALTLTRAGTQTQWLDVIPGGLGIFAKHVDGSWWASGENTYSSLGLPRRFGSESRIRQLTRIPFDLDVWALSYSGETTLILTRDGSIYYMGQAPGAPIHPASRMLGMAIVKNLYHRAAEQVAGARLMENPHLKWSQKPVKIGELPPSVISTLKRESVPPNTQAPN